MTTNNSKFVKVQAKQGGPNLMAALQGNPTNLPYEFSDFGSDPNISAHHMMHDFLNSG